MAGTDTETARQRTFNPPDTFLILFWLAAIAWLATFIVPAGKFTDADDGIQLANFELVGVQPKPIFAAGGDAGFLNMLFDGMVSGGPYSSAVGLGAFLLIIGGAFGVILRTGAMEAGLNAILTDRDKPADWLPPLLFGLFSIGGATFGMAEESIVFTIMLMPTFLRMGYDSLTVIFITFIGTVTGFYSSWMNPFSVIVAQGIADVPVLSGTGFRGALWLLYTSIGAVWIWRYARRIRLRTIQSRAASTDQTLIADLPSVPDDMRFGLGHIMILATMVLGIAWAIWGVSTQGYYFPELSAQFLTIGLVSAMIGASLRLNGMDFNQAARAFQTGATQFLPVVLMIGIAMGLIIILGGDDPSEPSVFNTFIAAIGTFAASVPEALVGVSMLLSQALINIFVTSGSGQAALTMPIMTPLADLAGLSRQNAVLAFQLGDGLTNMVTPLNAVLIGCLGVAKLSWTVWIRFIWRFFAMMFAISFAVMLFAVAIGFA
ncbi:MAG: putative basic amino acid antiporter YfcC [Pseudomonadota bacterium]